MNIYKFSYFDFTYAHNDGLDIQFATQTYLGIFYCLEVNISLFVNRSLDFMDFSGGLTIGKYHQHIFYYALCQVGLSISVVSTSSVVFHYPLPDQR